LDLNGRQGTHTERDFLQTEFSLFGEELVLHNELFQSLTEISGAHHHARSHGSHATSSICATWQTSIGWLFVMMLT
jgi:hypothetical protein